jgi:hypothetical protein
MSSRNPCQCFQTTKKKLRDVQLAATEYRYALCGGIDKEVACSSDTNFEPAAKLIRQDASHTRVSLVMPLRSDARGQGVSFNKRLAARAPWFVIKILDAESAAGQFIGSERFLGK